MCKKTIDRSFRLELPAMRRHIYIYMYILNLCFALHLRFHIILSFGCIIISVH